MLKYGEQQTKVLMDIMAEKMNAEQALDLLLSFRSSGSALLRQSCTVRRRDN